MINPFSTVKELKKIIKAKECTPSEVLSFYQDRLKKYNSTLNVLISNFETDLPSAKTEGKLAGIPCLVKSNLCIKNKKTTAGSKILSDFVPCYDSTMVENIKSQGGIILGHSNMDEFAMGSSGEFSAYGPTKNPWNLSLSPGGSSSGSASAVAAGLVPWALGSETGGSVRQPASYCGLVGLYPTYGLLSRFGLLAFGSSLDQPGPITRTVYDMAIILSVLAGYDSKDSTSLPEPKFDYTKKLDGKMPRSLKIGVLKDSFSQGVDPEIQNAMSNSIKVFEEMGATIKTIELPSLQYGIAVYFVVSRAEAASNLARIDGTLYGHRVANATQDLEEMYVKTRESGFGAEVKRRILLGNYVLSSEHRSVYEKANSIRNLIRSELEAAFDEFDILLSPSTASMPFKLGDAVNDPLAMYLNDYFTTPTCVAGYPGLAVPAGLSKEGLPIGIQILGPRLSEELLLAVGDAFERNSGFRNLNPQGYP